MRIYGCNVGLVFELRAEKCEKCKPGLASFTGWVVERP
jgi:hypothetical protein